MNSNFLTAPQTSWDDAVDTRTDEFVLEIMENVHNAMAAADVTRAELARRLNTQPPRISKLLGAHANPTIRTLVGVAAALGQDVHSFFRPREDRVFLEPVKPVLVFSRRLPPTDGGFVQADAETPLFTKPVHPRPVTQRDPEAGGAFVTATR